MAIDRSAAWGLARDLGFGDLDALARTAGVKSVTQISIYQADAWLRHAVARAIAYQQGDGHLQIIYEGFNGQKPLLLDIPRQNLDAISRTLLQARFDRLLDEDEISPFSRSLWLVQRAAGAYQHGIVVTPDTEDEPYAAIVAAIRLNLPAAVRHLPPKN